MYDSFVIAIIIGVIVYYLTSDGSSMYVYNKKLLVKLLNAALLLNFAAI